MDADAENSYYNAKGMREEEPGRAVEAFERVVEEEKDERTVWGFKCLKQLVKSHEKDEKAQDKPKMLAAYTSLLSYISTHAVTQNVSEKAINGILDRLSLGADAALMHAVYERTLEAFSKEGEASNDR